MGFKYQIVALQDERRINWLMFRSFDEAYNYCILRNWHLVDADTSYWDLLIVEMEEEF